MLHHRLSCFGMVFALLLQASATSFGATVLYAQTVGGLIFKSTDSAKSWQQLAPFTTTASSAALAVDPQNTNNLYSMYGGGVGKSSTGSIGVFRSTDGGDTWTETVLQNIGAPIAVDAASSNIIYLNVPGGKSAGLYRSTDYGISFDASGPATGLSSYSVSVIRNDPSQPGTVYVVIYNNGSIYKSTDYGVTWALITTSANAFNSAFGATITDLAVDPKNSSVLYLAANVSTCGRPATPCGLLKSTDAGKTWQPILGDNFGNIVVDPRNGNIYAGGYLPTSLTQQATGEFVKSTDGGKTFTKVTKGFSTLGLEVHLDPGAENLLYASQSRTVGGTGYSQGGVWVSTDAGASWTLSPVASSVAPPNDQIFSLVALTIKNPPPGVVNLSAASGNGNLFAPESIVSAFGAGLATETAGADTNPPPTTLAGASVSVTDSASTTMQAPLLYVSPVQINYVMPAGLAAGAAKVTFTGGGSTQSQNIQIAAIAPGMFTFNQAGLAAGSVLRVSGGNQTAENLFQMDSSGATVALPIDLGPPTDQVFVILYGTGFRAAGTAGASVTIGGVAGQVAYAGTQGGFAGLDQVNVLIPQTLAGRGSVNIVLKAGGQTANTVNISVK